jgi:hypothetical protein
VDSRHLARLIEEYAVDKVSAESASPDPDGRPRANDYLD